MGRAARRRVISTGVFILSVGMSGCFSSASSTSSGPAPETLIPIPVESKTLTITGKVGSSPVVNALVKAFTLDEQGNTVALLGSAVTGYDGNFVMEISNTTASIEFRAAGDGLAQFIDEATGQQVAQTEDMIAWSGPLVSANDTDPDVSGKLNFFTKMTAFFGFSAEDPLTDVSDPAHVISINALTTIAAYVSWGLTQEGYSPEVAENLGDLKVREIFGLTESVVRTIPAHPTERTPLDSVNAVAAAKALTLLSQLASQNEMKDSMEMAAAIAADLASDGNLEGGLAQYFGGIAQTPEAIDALLSWVSTTVISDVVLPEDLDYQKVKASSKGRTDHPHEKASGHDHLAFLEAPTAGVLKCEAFCSNKCTADQELTGTCCSYCFFDKNSCPILNSEKSSCDKASQPSGERPSSWTLWRNKGKYKIECHTNLQHWIVNKVPDQRAGAPQPPPSCPVGKISADSHSVAGCGEDTSSKATALKWEVFNPLINHTQDAGAQTEGKKILAVWSPANPPINVLVRETIGFYKGGSCVAKNLVAYGAYSYSPTLAVPKVVKFRFFMGATNESYSFMVLSSLQKGVRSLSECSPAVKLVPPGTATPVKFESEFHAGQFLLKAHWTPYVSHFVKSQRVEFFSGVPCATPVGYAEQAPEVVLQLFRNNPTEGQTYCFRVTTLGENGWGEPSGYTSVGPLKKPKPAAVLTSLNHSVTADKKLILHAQWMPAEGASEQTVNFYSNANCGASPWNSAVVAGHAITASNSPFNTTEVSTFSFNVTSTFEDGETTESEDCILHTVPASPEEPSDGESPTPSPVPT